MLNRRTVCLALGLAPLVVHAASKKSMSIIVPYPPGGPLDNVARLLGDAIKPIWGKTVINNIAGGAGARGMLACKNAAADGKTLVMGAVATLAINPLTIPNLPYKSEDFKPVTLLSDVPNVLVVTPSTMDKFKITSAKNLIDFIKNNPDRLNCASGGTGSIGHIANAVLNANGLKTTHVPYAGASQAQLSLFSGETDFMFDNYASCQQAIKEGRLKALAVTTKERSQLIDCPSMTEVGISMDYSTWFGLFASKETSPETCFALYNDIRSVLAQDKVQQKLLIATPLIRLMDPEAFSDFVALEQQKYKHLFESIKLI